MKKAPKVDKDIIMQLQKRLQQADGALPLWDPCEQPEVSVGQVWQPAMVESDTVPSFLLLVLASPHDGLFNVVPLSRWTELAGPDDLIIPANISPVRLVVALELICTVNSDMLSICQGRAPKPIFEYIRSALACGDDWLEDPAFVKGPNWIGPQDHRLQYAHAIAETIEAMQSKCGFTMQEESVTGTTIQFPPWLRNIDLAAAADDSFHSYFSLLKSQESLIAWTEPENAKHGFAHCLSFEPPEPGKPDSVYCEWSFPRNNLPENLQQQAFVFDRRHQTFIGMGSITARSDDWLLSLTQHQLLESEHPVLAPEDIHIVLQEKG